MSNILKIGMALSVLVPATTLPANAQDENQILVQTGSAVSELVGQQLNRQLARAAYPGNASGIVRVHFFTDQNGEVERVSLFERSGDFRLDHAAIRAVERMNVSEAPNGIDAGDKEVLATIIYAESRRDAHRLERRAWEANEAIFASGDLSPHVLAITLGSGFNY